MGILSNFIGGAAEAGGNILQRQRESDVELQKQQQYAKYADDLARARELTTMELRKQYEQERDQYLASPEYLEMQAKAEAAKATAKVDTEEKLAPRTRAIRIEDAKAVKKAEFDPEIQALMRKAENEKLTAAEQAKLDFYSKNKTAIVGQIRDEARARHIESAGSLAQAALAKVQLENAQTASALRTQLAEARASGNDDAVQAIQQQITDLAFTGKDTAAAYRTYSTAQAKLIDLEAKLSDPSKMLEPGQVAQLKGEIEEARMVQRQAAKDLGVALPDKAAKAGKNGWDSTTGQVFRNGEVVGTAKTEQEARAMAKSGAHAKDAEKPAEKKPGGIIESVRPDPPKPPTTLETMESDKTNSLRPMADAFKVAEQQFVATARSGDQQAMQRQMAIKEKLRADLERAASAKFGNKAPEVLRQLGI